MLKRKKEKEETVTHNDVQGNLCVHLQRDFYTTNKYGYSCVTSEIVFLTVCCSKFTFLNVITILPRTQQQSFQFLDVDKDEYVVIC